MRDLFTAEQPFYWTMGIILFLLLYAIMTYIVVNKKIKKLRPQQKVSFYLFLKTGKLFLFLMAVVIYSLAVNIETKRFVLVAVAIYFIYMLWDTWFLTSVEKKLKKNVEK